MCVAKDDPCSFVFTPRDVPSFPNKLFSIMWHHTGGHKSWDCIVTPVGLCEVLGEQSRVLQGGLGGIASYRTL